MHPIMKHFRLIDVLPGLAIGAALAAAGLGSISIDGGLLGSLLFLYHALPRRQEMAALTAQLANHAELWDVTVNGVTVGEISAAEHAAICLRVRRAWDTRIAQVLNVVGGAAATATDALSAVPAILTWLVLVVALVNPAAFATGLAQVASMTPADMQAAAGMLLAAMAAGLLVTVVLVTILRAETLAAKVVDDRIADGIRRRLRVAANGEVVLVRWHGTRHGTATEASLR